MDEAYRYEPESLDILFETLAETRRHYVLHCLKDDGNPVDVGDLAEQVARIERGPAGEELTKEEVTNVQRSLHHWHLPKLARTDIVQYDPDNGTVALVEDTKLRGRAGRSVTGD